MPTLFEQPIRALLVEADHEIWEGTASILRSHWIEATRATDGIEILSAIRKGGFDIAVLDVETPRLGGLELCQEIRAVSAIPIIVTTAQANQGHCVRALELGADDCLTRPLSLRELVARIRVHVRRSRGSARPRPHLDLGRLKIDLQQRFVRLDGRELSLTTHEFSLLQALAAHAGHVINREQLLETTRGSAEDAFDRSIDVLVSRLRQKLGDDPRRPALLKTVRGRGYLLAKELLHDTPNSAPSRRRR